MSGGDMGERLQELAAGSDCHTAERRPDGTLTLWRKLGQSEAFDRLVAKLERDADLEVLPHRQHTDRFTYDMAHVAERKGRRP